MQSRAEHIHDAAVRHRIALSRYSTHAVRRILALLHRTEDSLLGRIKAAGDVPPERLQALLDDVRQIQRDGWRLIDARVTGDVAELAKVEADFTERLAGGPSVTATFSPLPSEQQLVAAANARPFSGRVLKDWLADVEEGAAARVRDTIRQGFVEGRTTDQIVRELAGTKANGYADGALAVSRDRIDAMVRTALTHTASVAQQETYKALGVKEWRFTATLDARVSLICMSLHGHVYPVGKGPMPPRHPRCRSTTVPVVAEIPGVKPFEFPTFATWLKNQPAPVQDDVLGVTRARLFRSGALPLDRFVDGKDRVLTIDELRRRDAQAFRAAGLKGAA